MKFTKFGHACVSLEKDGRSIVIDPGMFTDPSAVDGADAVLITHEHADHLSLDNLRRAVEGNAELQIWCNQAVAKQLDPLSRRLNIVGHGDAFDAAGFSVQVHGEMHAVIHPDIPQITNIGYLVDNQVFHPGDALTVPDAAIETLMLPTHAPWSKVSELIDYVREVNPSYTYAVHDGLLNETGFGIIGKLLGSMTPTHYERLAAGECAQVN